MKNQASCKVSRKEDDASVHLMRLSDDRSLKSEAHPFKPSGCWRGEKSFNLILFTNSCILELPPQCASSLNSGRKKFNHKFTALPRVLENNCKTDGS